MRNAATHMLAALTLAASVTGGVTMADSVEYRDSVIFRSDFQDPRTLMFPGFDPSLGTLDRVTVELVHSGSVLAAGDNDDEFQGCDTQARMIRQWDATGPDVIAFGARTITSDIVFLAADDGDGDTFDPSPPDGAVFDTLEYDDTSAGVFNPDLNLYIGGVVDFEIVPTLMVQDLRFPNEAPDEWQLEVRNPRMEIEVIVTYEYTPDCTLELGYDGECPDVVLEATCGTPNGEGWVFFAYELGNETVPNGPCAGAPLDLGPSFRQVGVFEFDGNGEWRLDTILKECACLGYLQIVDLTTCQVSNVIELN
ncbi:MAG: choice-of-anchor E domain-containing protein [Planctomycetota bacterium]